MGPSDNAPQLPRASTPIVVATQKTRAVASHALSPRGCLNPCRAIQYEPRKSQPLTPAPSSPFQAIVPIDLASTAVSYTLVNVKRDQPDRANAGRAAWQRFAIF